MLCDMSRNSYYPLSYSNAEDTSRCTLKMSTILRYRGQHKELFIFAEQTPSPFVILLLSLVLQGMKAFVLCNALRKCHVMCHALFVSRSVAFSHAAIFGFIEAKARNFAFNSIVTCFDFAELAITDNNVSFVFMLERFNGPVIVLLCPPGLSFCFHFHSISNFSCLLPLPTNPHHCHR